MAEPAKRGRPPKAKKVEGDNVVQAAEQIVKTRGSKPASLEANITAKREEISQIIGESFQFFKQPIVKSDEECIERLNWYFSLCNERGQIPTVEDMCLALGTVRQTVWSWEQGSLGGSRQDIIKKAKEILAGIDAKLVSQGKIPQITYIFRAKNFFGMKDQQEYVLTPNQPLGSDGEPATISGKYQAALPEATIDVE